MKDAEDHYDTCPVASVQSEGTTAAPLQETSTLLGPGTESPEVAGAAGVCAPNALHGSRKLEAPHDQYQSWHAGLATTGLLQGYRPRPIAGAKDLPKPSKCPCRFAVGVQL